MLYKDRGMLKWQGLILAEHKEQIEAAAKASNRIIPRKEQLSEAKISWVLQDAFNHHKTINIQLNTINNGLYKDNFVGTIKGFEEGMIYLHSNSELKQIEIDSIRHVECVKNIKWFE